MRIPRYALPPLGLAALLLLALAALSFVPVQSTAPLHDAVAWLVFRG